MQRFIDCLTVTLGYEGGFSNDAGDPGGATNLGIELQEWNKWKESHGEPDSSVEDFAKSLTEQDVEPISLQNYWMKVNDGSLPPPVDMAAFDSAVNLGVWEGLKYLAETENIADPKDRALTMCDLRIQTYHKIAENKPDEAQFLQGWLNRVNDLQDKIKAGAI